MSSRAVYAVQWLFGIGALCASVLALLAPMNVIRVLALAALGFALAGYMMQFALLRLVRTTPSPQHAK